MSSPTLNSISPTPQPTLDSLSLYLAHSHSRLFHFTPLIDRRKLWRDFSDCFSREAEDEAGEDLHQPTHPSETRESASLAAIDACDRRLLVGSVWILSGSSWGHARSYGCSAVRRGTYTVELAQLESASLLALFCSAGVWLGHDHAEQTSQESAHTISWARASPDRSGRCGRARSGHLSARSARSSARRSALSSVAPDSRLTSFFTNVTVERSSTSRLWLCSR